MKKPMSIVFYDKTDKYLSWIWAFWAHIGYLLGFYTHVYGVSSWKELYNIADSFPWASLDEVQIWGHGAPGAPYINLVPERLEKDGDFIRTFSRLLHMDSVLWFRSCNVFTGVRGWNFATRANTYLKCNVAAHTYVIGTWGLSSGLHLMRTKDEVPHWDQWEGIGKDSKHLRSSPRDRPLIPAMLFHLPKKDCCKDLNKKL